MDGEIPCAPLRESRSSWSATRPGTTTAWAGRYCSACANGRWRGPSRPGTDLAECDLDPGRLIRLWDHTDLTVVLEAARTRPSHPGRIHRLELDARRLARPDELGPRGLGEAMEAAWELDRLPSRLVAYAVEVTDTSLGPGLSPSVAAAVDTLVGRVEDEIVRHRVAAARGTTDPATA